MSLSAERVEKILGEDAVVCCRTEVGTIIKPANLEDPDILPDLIASELITIPDDILKIEQVLGAKVTKTIDSLTPLTPENLEGYKEIKKDKKIELDETAKAVLKFDKKAGDTLTADCFENPMNFDKMIDSKLFVLNDDVVTIGQALGKKIGVDLDALNPIKDEMLEGYARHLVNRPVAKVHKEVKNDVKFNGGIMKIKIGEGKDINIEIPVSMMSNNYSQDADDSVDSFNEVSTDDANANVAYAGGTVSSNSAASDNVRQEAKKIRNLVKKHHKITKVDFADETKIEEDTLYIRENICDDAVKVSDLVKSIKIDIITPDRYNEYSNTIMDIQPIATKEKDDKLGTGTTRVLDGVIVMVTGIDENGVQIGEFGSSEGILEENIMWNRPGAPDKGEIFIKTEVVIQAGMNMERPGPYAAHKATDAITQEIRNVMKELDDSMFENSEELVQYRRPGKKKIVIVKEIMGQGAMHDNLILPVEPVGVFGGKPNVDLGNVPVALNPIEVLDGGIHALTCIGPASKECSRHYYREPLVMEAMNDEDVDLCGVIFVGSPQINSEKFYVSERLGNLVEMLDVDGAIVTTEGFGNNHIDFASHIEQIGMRGIEVVGMSFCGVQGALVVGNKYIKHMVDCNKSEEGIENEVLGCNTLCKEDALRALEMLKSALSGEEVKAAERKWNQHVKENNLDIIEETKNIQIERVPNETTIPLSEKRKSKMGGNQ